MALPAFCMAAAPGPVSNLSGELSPDGEVVVRWDPLQDKNIVLYRLYYSAESIIDSQGLYDDFEETLEPVPEFIFTNPPKQEALYVTVLAVNSSGEESESFAEEIRIDLTPAPAPSTPPPAQPKTPPVAAQSSAPAAWTVPSSATFVPPTPDIALPTIPDLGILTGNGRSSAGAAQSAWMAVPTMPQVPPPPAASSSSSSSSSIAPQVLPPPVLTLPKGPKAQGGSASVPTLAPPPSDGTVHLLSAEALSPTQVKLAFSAPVTIDALSAPQAFHIEGPGGTSLHITQMLMSDQMVILDTAEQQKGSPYTVLLREPLRGERGEPLHPQDRKADFVGHELSTAIASTPVTSAYDPLRPSDVLGFRLRATPDLGAKTYTVLAQWQADVSRSDIAYYVVRQSLDGGTTFSDPQTVPMDIAGIEIKGAQPGTLGIALSVVNIYGGVSAGVFDAVTLPGATPSAPIAPPPAAATPQLPAPVQPQIPAEILAMMQGKMPARKPVVKPVVSKDARAKNLSKTGVGLLAVGSSVVGAFAGWRKTTKRAR
jgi:hypothetical protein